MRIWDLPTHQLCRKHLLGEHREIHAIWTILTTGRKGYTNHPETKRWKGKLAALYTRHEEQVKEMEKRKYQHKSPLDILLAVDQKTQDIFINSLEEQKEILNKKLCACFS